MEYNNKLRPIILPSYGRNVQNMVIYCQSLPSREDRQRCALEIIRTMANVAPDLQKDGGDSVYWDHLAIMSDFTLDIDFPEGTITKEEITSSVPKPPYDQHPLKYRYYGNIIQQMIAKAVEMPEGEERRELEYLIAMQMKRSYMTWNQINVEDVKIFQDLYEISRGKIMLTPEMYKLEVNPNTIDKNGSKSKAKKKKK